MAISFFIFSLSSIFFSFLIDVLFDDRLENEQLTFISTSNRATSKNIRLLRSLGFICFFSLYV